MKDVITDQMMTDEWLKEFNDKYQNTTQMMTQELVNNFVRAQSLPDPIAAYQMKTRLIEKYDKHWKGRLSTHIKLLESAYEYALNTTEVTTVMMTPEELAKQELKLKDQIDTEDALQVQELERALEEAWFEANIA